MVPASTASAGFGQKVPKTACGFGDLALGGVYARAVEEFEQPVVVVLGRGLLELGEPP